ncbi:MAG TPA: hypothetical protein PLK58_06345 [Candidatus Rifleibacterium sp.]|jgi:type II secretory ATPase GspE/PulE/Tfp pilus assembly ATPase PilB-like protein|nr:hypothetical protein [Candidatus Rifleibacterium sp.]
MNQDIDNKLISCRVCGIIMVKLARDVCPTCFRQEEELFQKVKNFLRTNPGASVTQVAEHAGCDEDQVQAFINSGRLERVGLRKVAHPCQLCQKIIYEGVMCPECKKDLKDQVNNLKEPRPEPKESRSTGRQAPDKGTGKDVFDKKKDEPDGGHVGKRKN